MMEKFDDILARYNVEVDIVALLFKKYKYKTLIQKNYPPIAGASGWAKSLYVQGKKPIMRFRAMDSLQKSDRGEVVKTKYINLAKDIDRYVQHHYQSWIFDVTEVAMANLRVPVLGPRAIIASNGELQLPSPPYFVDFSTKLTTIIRESKCLDKMGFVVPEIAANIALQEEKYSLYIMQLKGMLQRYETVYSSLLPVERYVLKQQLEKLQIAIKPGFDRLN